MIAATHFAKGVATVNRGFAVVASALVLAVALAVFQDVVRRYALGAPSLWASDFAKYGLTYIFFLGLGPALQSGHHVAVDLFDSLWPAPLARMMPRVSAGACILFGLVFLWFLARTALNSFERDPLAQTIVPIRLKYIHVIGPIGCLQFILTAVAIFITPRPKVAA